MYPVLANGHRLKRTPSNPLCLPENLISKYTPLYPDIMILPAWASNPDSPSTVARQRVPRRYQQRCTEAGYANEIRGINRIELFADSTTLWRSVCLYTIMQSMMVGRYNGSPRWDINIWICSFFSAVRGPNGIFGKLFNLTSEVELVSSKCILIGYYYTVYDVVSRVKPISVC